jgi:predicted RNA-binding protein YlqC (UPF0109 family)
MRIMWGGGVGSFLLVDQGWFPRLAGVFVFEENTMEKDLVEYIVKSLVEDPSLVTVSVVEGEKSTILELRVGPKDIGKVIGKHGRIAKAIRTVLQASATNSGKHTVLEILD